MTLEPFDEFDDGQWPLESWQWDLIGAALAVVLGMLTGIAVTFVT